MTTQQTGQHAEDKALAYLIAKGLKPVTRNYSCRLGEIDLIMRDNHYLVFIEVRSRISGSYGGGIGSITGAKRKKIIKASQYYLTKNQLHEKNPLRFDVVSIDGQPGAITWLKDAFGLDY